MGCCFPCLRPSSAGYQSIPEHRTGDGDLPKSVEIVGIPVGISSAVAVQKDEGSPFHNVSDAKEDALVLKEFDLNSSVFKGTVVDQKFTNKSTYEPKFAWINPTSRSINLSEHMSKDRRHKEASLADIVTIIAGPPEKFRNPSDATAALDFRLCITVNFQRGGGIDLKFKSEEERDTWHKVLNRLVRNEQQ